MGIASAREEPRVSLSLGLSQARRYTLENTRRRRVHARLTALLQLPIPNLQLPRDASGSDFIGCWDLGTWGVGSLHGRERHSRSADRDHPAIPGLRALVHRRGPSRRAGRLLTS